jgi:glycosyltransferase involved in cell wall biosynthesis
MRIAILTSWYPSQRGPIVGSFALGQAAVLAEEHEVALVAPVRIWWREAWRTLPGPMPVEQQGRVTVFRQRWLSPFPRCPLYWTHRRACHALRRGFADLLRVWGRPDVIHAHVVLPAGYAAAELGATYGIPTVLTEHSGPFAMHLGTSGERRMVRAALRGMSRVLAVGPSLREQMLAFAPDLSVEVVGNVIATRFFRPAPEKRQTPVRRLLAVGGLVPDKGHAHLLQAAAELLGRGHTDFELRIAGDGSLRPVLEAQAKSLGLGDHCRFLGWLTPAQVRDEMQQCDLFVVSSLCETFCIAAGEALACAKPVLTTRCGGPEHLVSPATGMVVEPGSPAALADALQRFLDGVCHFDPSTIRASIAVRFGEEAFLRGLGRVYASLAAPARVAASSEALP